MKNLSKFFTAVSGVFAVLPGVGVLLSNIGVPPNISGALFGGVIEALGVLTLMLLWLNKDWIRNLSSRRVNIISLISIAGFIISLFSYLFLYNSLVLGNGISEPVYFPLWSNGELKDGLKMFKNGTELISQWGRDDVVTVIQSSSQNALLVTTIILLFIYQLIFVTLTFSFGLLGIRSSPGMK